MTVQKEPGSGPDPRATLVSLDAVLERLRAAGALYLEFLAAPGLRSGLYLLPVGSVDSQSPHTEDEIYFVIRGSATAILDDRPQTVRSGDTIYVAAGVAHHFHTIVEDLLLLVLFAPGRSRTP